MTQMSGMKNAVTPVIHFLNGPQLNFLFYCHIILYSVTSYEKFSQNGTFEFQTGKPQRFNAIDGSIEMQKNGSISKNFSKMKNIKIFLNKLQAALRKLFSSPPDKNFLPLWHKNLSRYTGIYRHLLSKCFENAVLGCLGMVQSRCFF